MGALSGSRLSQKIVDQMKTFNHKETIFPATLRHKTLNNGILDSDGMDIIVVEEAQDISIMKGREPFGESNTCRYCEKSKVKHSI